MEQPFYPPLYNVIHYNSTNSSGYSSCPMRKNTSWQPVSCVLSLEWSHPPPVPDIRARRFRYSEYPIHKRMHIAYKLKKDKLLRKDSKCLHMYFKPSMKNNSFQKKKNRYKSGFSVCFSWKAEPVLLFLMEKISIC